MSKAAALPKLEGPVTVVLLTTDRRELARATLEPDNKIVHEFVKRHPAAAIIRVEPSPPRA